MSDETPQNHAHQFERAIATAFTCRSIIKYNSTLSEAQQNELLTDIDSTVHFLQERLTANTAIETNSLLTKIRQQATDTSSTFSYNEENENTDNSGTINATSNNDFKRQLYVLQKMYHYYFETLPGQQQVTFISRFNEVMTALDQAQLLIEREPHSFSRANLVEDHLHRVRGYVADMYTAFTEFARSLSNALQGHDIYIDTEKQASFQQTPVEDIHTTFDITVLLKVYETHELLNQKMGSVTSRTGDATAFLIFLQDQLEGNINKRAEIIAQLNTVAVLLNDLRYLLADYERAVAALLNN